MSEGGEFTGVVIRCPLCDWSTEAPENLASAERAFAEVDAELHWKNDHSDEEVPEDAEFGRYRCPQCKDFDGFCGTVSCSNCGFIPESVRA